MSPQSLAPSFLAPVFERRRRPLWQRMISAIAAGRQRAAERDIARHLQCRRGQHEDDFRIELERRLLGQ